MKKRIEKHVPKAIDIAKGLMENGKIDKAYNGYISSFGAAVIQSGLVPAVAFFSYENAKSDIEKGKKNLMAAIAKLLDLPNDTDLLRHVIDNDNALTKDRVLDMATSLKLAIRTYPLREKK